ncbi:MAG: dockerin type I repeat-containing protein [Acidobacteriota bacterium]
MKPAVALLILFATPALLFAQSPCCSLGDIDDSGTLKARDILMINQHLQGLECLTEEQLCRADVDGDGQVTSADAQLLQEFILGLRSTFPRCGDLDGDGKLEWGTFEDDVNAFTSCYVNPKGPGCENADANNDGVISTEDAWILLDVANGQVLNFPGCACGEGACADPS